MRDNPYASPLDNAFGQLLVVPLMALGLALTVWGICPGPRTRAYDPPEPDDLRKDLERLNPYF